MSDLIDFTEVLANAFIKISSDELGSFTTQPLNSKQRAEVHELCKNAGLITKSLSIFNCPEKRIEIKKSNPSEIVDFEITKEMIEFFAKFAQVPIPTTNPLSVTYYLEELKKYYNCHLWSIFIKEVQKNGLGKLRYDCGHVRTEIIKYIKENPEYVAFCELPTSDLNQRAPIEIRTKNSIYQQNHTNKHFISVDIKSANYTFLKSVCPSITKSWKELVGTFVDSEFIAESKYIREIVFGELGNKKLLSNILLLIKRVFDLVESDDVLRSALVKTVCTTDEIIYEVSDNYDIAYFNSKIHEIDPDQSVYRVEKFKLVQLTPYPYFVKEIDMPTGINKIQFKSINKNHIMQCIKHYEGRPVNTADKKFMCEEFEATFDDVLVFDKKYN